MKKVLIACLVIVAILGSCFAFGSHEQRMSRYVEAPIQTATFEELLTAPYATDGSWEFYEVLSMYHEESTSSAQSPPDHEKLIADLRALLKDQAFTGVPKQGFLRSYDGYFENLFSVKPWETSFYLQLRCTSVQLPQDGATEVTGVRVFALDNACCYLVVSYQTEPEPNTTHFVFSSDDPVLLENVSALICSNLQN